MNTILKLLYEKTMSLVSDIENIDYVVFEELIELREQCINTLSEGKSITEEEKELIRLIGQFDELILSRMVQLRDEASQGLNKIEHTRKQRSSYDAHYEGGSYFIDIRN